MNAHALPWIRRVLVIGVLALVPVGLVAAQSAPPRPVGLNVWIDRPLDGTVVTSSPVRVTAHVAHPDGPTRAQLRVAGRPVGEPIDVGGDPFEIVEFDWTPTTNGVIPVSVAGAVGDSWGTSITVEVVVGIPGLSEEESTPPGATTTPPAGPPPTPTDPIPTTAASTSIAPVATTSAPTTVTTAPASTAPPTTAAPSTVAPTTTSTPTTAPPTTTTPPCTNGRPHVNGPADNARNYSVTWTYSGCTPGGFTVYVAEDSGFTDLIVQASVDSSARQHGPFPVESCRQYFVRVSAEFEAVSIASPTHTFTTPGC